MGCSSSTQTHNQGGSRPPAKAVETNGPKKMSTSEVSDHIIDDIETIPDQTKLVPLTENEPSTNGIPPEEEQVEVEEAIEVDGAETTPNTEDSNGAFLSAEEEPAQAEEPTEVITNQDSSVVEASEVSDHIIDDIETIPDQTKLVPLTANEPSTNGIPPEEEQVEVEEAIEVDGAETMPNTEDSNGAFLSAEEEPAQAEEPTEVITNQDSSVVEGEIEEAIEANNHEEEIVSKEPETKEDETEHPTDAAEPEMNTADAEE